jgi:hypothetical protein
MTKDEALDKALEAMEHGVATCFDRCAHEQVMSRPEHFINQAITAIKQALAAPTVQEPVGEVSGHDWSTGLLYRDLEPGTPLYTTPPAAQRQWVGLTDEEIRHINRSTMSLPIEEVLNSFARAIEAKLKEKNT